jgi:hypothetical protein
MNCMAPFPLGFVEDFAEVSSDSQKTRWRVDSNEEEIVAKKRGGSGAVVVQVLAHADDTRRWISAGGGVVW